MWNIFTEVSINSNKKLYRTFAALGKFVELEMIYPGSSKSPSQTRLLNFPQFKGFVVCKMK